MQGCTSPTQHSITKSRVSFAQATSLGNNSAFHTCLILGKGDIWAKSPPAIIFATVAFGRERSSSDPGAPPCPSWSDIASIEYVLNQVCFVDCGKCVERTEGIWVLDELGPASDWTGLLCCRSHLTFEVRNCTLYHHHHRHHVCGSSLIYVLSLWDSTNILDLIGESCQSQTFHARVDGKTRLC